MRYRRKHYWPPGSKPPPQHQPSQSSSKSHTRPDLSPESRHLSHDIHVLHYICSSWFLYISYKYVNVSHNMETQPYITCQLVLTLINTLNLPLISHTAVTVLSNTKLLQCNPPRYNFIIHTIESPVKVVRYGSHVLWLVKRQTTVGCLRRSVASQSINFSGSLVSEVIHCHCVAPSSTVVRVDESIQTCCNKHFLPVLANIYSGMH